jgi:hypothetical protein
METERATSRILWLFLALLICSVRGFASDPPLPQPVATLALAALHPSDRGESDWATVAFSSETSIAVGQCRPECSLSLVGWEGGALHPFAQTLRFDTGVSIHAAAEGRILASESWLATVLYSADLSTTRDLPKHLSHVSRSGKTVAEWADGSWKLYRLTDRLEPLREGTGELRSVSDEVAVIQEGKVMRVETLDGKRLGSFSLRDEAWGSHAALLGNTKLYLDDCRRVRVADFKGKTQLEMHPRGGCDQGNRSSTDGRRMLFDFTSHKVSGLEKVLESLRAIVTFGMAGAEDVNREEVRVFDTVTGKSCFDWHRSFPMTYRRVSSAAISPSGGFVAIAAGNTLSVYRFPEICEASTITSGR